MSITPAWIQTVCLQHPPVYAAVISFLCGISLPDPPLLVPWAGGLVCCSSSPLGAWSLCFFYDETLPLSAIRDAYTAWVEISGVQGNVCLISRDERHTSTLIDWKQRHLASIHTNVYALHSKPVLNAMALHPSVHVNILALWASETADPARIPCLLDAAGDTAQTLHLQQAARILGTPFLQRALAYASKRARRSRRSISSERTRLHRRPARQTPRTGSRWPTAKMAQR